MRLLIRATAGLLLGLGLSAQSMAGVVFLDFTDFGTRLDDATTAAATSNFSAGEKSTIQSNILSGLQSAYSAFGGLSFTTVDPGGVRSTLNFGLTAGAGSLGVADHIDFLNQVQDDVARVFSGNFGFIIESFESKATQISELSAALTGTAVHELGHNLGLRHHDAYGDLQYTGTDIATGGAQNGNWMATGSTGLSETGREAVRKFSDNSLVKLAFAEGTLATNETAILEEGGDAGATLGTAQVVDLTEIAVANAFGEVVTGTINNGADEDLFRVSLAAGSVFTADINIDYASTIAFNNVNTDIALLDSLGNVLFSDDVSAYSGNTYGSGGSGDGFDPALFNVPILTAGDYFVRVSSVGADTGDYQLLMHTNLAVPEPGSLAAISLGMLYLARRRRR